MRKLIGSTLVSLDGVIGDPRSWAGDYFDEAARDEALAQLLASDAMLMGRHTYEYFAPAWPAMTGDYADRINSMRKYVFSSTLETADWNNSTIIAGAVAAAVADLKQQDGLDLVIYGHGQLGKTLLEHDLFDELHFRIHPLVVGRGTPLFRAGEMKTLTLAATRSLPTGVVKLSYHPARTS